MGAPGKRSHRVDALALLEAAERRLDAAEAALEAPALELDSPDDEPGDGPASLVR